MDRQKLKKAFKAAFPGTIPVFTGFLVLGLAYGMLMQTKGYGAVWSLLMSLIVFGGSVQYLAISLLTIPFNPIQAFLLSLMVNARHLFYGISLLDKYKGLGKLRAFLIYTMCDETFSLCYGLEAPEGVDRGCFYFAISLLNYLYWAVSSFLGGILGSFISFNTKGMDFALTALFVVMFIEQLRDKNKRIAGLIGIAGTTASLVIFGADKLVIPAMVIIAASLLMGRKKLCI